MRIHLSYVGTKTIMTRFVKTVPNGTGIEMQLTAEH